LHTTDQCLQVVTRVNAHSHRKRECRTTLKGSLFQILAVRQNKKWKKKNIENKLPTSTTQYLSGRLKSISQKHTTTVNLKCLSFLLPSTRPLRHECRLVYSSYLNIERKVSLETCRVNHHRCCRLSWQRVHQRYEWAPPLEISKGRALTNSLYCSFCTKVDGFLTVWPRVHGKILCTGKGNYAPFSFRMQWNGIGGSVTFNTCGNTTKFFWLPYIRWNKRRKKNCVISIDC
jgi:hypothetical protein